MFLKDLGDMLEQEKVFFFTVAAVVILIFVLLLICCFTCESCNTENKNHDLEANKTGKQKNDSCKPVPEKKREQVGTYNGAYEREESLGKEHAKIGYQVAAVNEDTGRKPKPENNVCRNGRVSGLSPNEITSQNPVTWDPRPSRSLSKKGKRNRSMSRGLYPRLDLHGHSVSDACQKAEAFYAECKQKGVFQFKLITGKGKHSPNEAQIKPAVLRMAKRLGWKCYVDQQNEGVIIVKL